MKLKIYLFVALIALIGITQACSKKKWDKTAKSELQLKVSENFNSPDYSVTIQNFSLHAESIALRGTRLQGEPVQIIDDNNNNLEFKSGVMQHQLTFNIPQGTFSALSLDISVLDITNNIKITGAFADESSSKDFILEIDYSDFLSIMATNVEESNLYSIEADRNVTLNLICRTDKLFETVSQEMWNSSVPDFVTNIVTISPNSNQALYSSFLSQLSHSLEFTLE